MAGGFREKVRVLINPDSGIGVPYNAVCQALRDFWESPERDLTIQITTSREDGRAKAKQAVEEGTDILLVAGGDGAVNTAGGELVGTNTCMGVIPSGSGNGFARHFGIPLNIRRAVEVLADASPALIDVGCADGRPFFVTCSLAWDAALVEVFEKSPIRGILPYVFAAVYKFFEYVPQSIRVVLDGSAEITIDDPMVFTVANLTQYGGGVRIAPSAQADDGMLQLVTLRQRDLPWVLPMLGSVFSGNVDRLERVETRSFRTMSVRRDKKGPMQIDGELIEAPESLEIRVRPRALRVLVPRRTRNLTAAE